MNSAAATGVAPLPSGQVGTERQLFLRAAKGQAIFQSRGMCAPPTFSKEMHTEVPDLSG
jgi:hypothetical protein